MKWGARAGFGVPLLYLSQLAQLTMLKAGVWGELDGKEWGQISQSDRMDLVSGHYPSNPLPYPDSTGKLNLEPWLCSRVKRPALDSGPYLRLLLR